MLQNISEIDGDVRCQYVASVFNTDLLLPLSVHAAPAGPTSATAYVKTKLQLRRLSTDCEVQCQRISTGIRNLEMKFKQNTVPILPVIMQPTVRRGNPKRKGDLLSAQSKRSIYCGTG